MKIKITEYRNGFDKEPTSSPRIAEIDERMGEWGKDINKRPCIVARHGCLFNNMPTMGIAVLTSGNKYELVTEK